MKRRENGGASLSEFAAQQPADYVPVGRYGPLSVLPPHLVEEIKEARREHRREGKILKAKVIKSWLLEKHGIDIPERGIAIGLHGTGRLAI